MPTVRHPRALDDVVGHPPAAVTVSGATYAVDRSESPATVDLPTDRHVRELANAYDLDASDLTLSQTCDVVKADGEVCGRETPCPYHSE